MYYSKYFYVLFSFIFLLGLVHSADIPITGCMDLNSDYFDDTLILQNDINSWSGNCFQLTSDYAGHNLTFDCDSHFINDINVLSNAWFYTNEFKINTMSFVNCNLRTYYSTTLLIDSNVNLVNIIDSNIYLQGLSAFVRTADNHSNILFDFNGSNLFNYDLSGSKRIFDLSGSYYDIFTINNLDINTVGATANISLVYLANNSNVNNLKLLDSSVDTRLGSVILDESLVSSLTLDFNNTIFYRVPETYFIKLNNVVHSVLNISNLDLNVNYFTNSAYALIYYNSSAPDVNSTNIINSDIDLNNGRLFWISGGTNKYQAQNNFTFTNSDILCTSTALPFYLFSNIGTFTISGLDLRSTSNVFTLSDINISNLILFDSNLAIDLFANLNSNSNILAGSIYNNKIIDSNYGNNFVTATAGHFNLDFNTSLNTNNPTKRQLWLTDDSNAVGGNLWLYDNNGANICTLDSADPKGICDSNITLIGSSENYIDYLPLVEYDSNLDLSAMSVELSQNNLVYNNPITITFDYNNVGTEDVQAGDYNVVFYYVKNSIEYDLNWVVGTNLIVDPYPIPNIEVSYIWDVNDFGDINICAKIDHPSDVNVSNDSLCAETYYRDVNVVSLVMNHSSNYIYGDTIDVNIGLGNTGNYDSNDLSLYVFVIDDSNEENYSIKFIQQECDALARMTSYCTTTWQVNLFNVSTGIVDYNVYVFNENEDFNTLNDIRYFDQNGAIIYHDPYISSITNTDGNLGTSIDVNCLLAHNGNGTFSTIYSDLNVLFYVNGSLQDYNDSVSSSLIRFNYIPTIYSDINFACDVNYVFDYNTSNNYISTIESINGDLNTSIIVEDVNVGQTGDVNCIVSNLGVASADFDLRIYVNGALQSYDPYTLESEQTQVYTESWSPERTGDYNVMCLAYFIADYNQSNNSDYIVKTAYADTNVDLSVTDISLSSTVAGSVTVTCDINNIGDENATSDYNVKLYVDDVLLSSNDINTQLNVDAEASTTFSWTSTAGTHSLECVADYNVNNYTGYDANISNNSYSESFTITSGTTAPSGGGGGGGSSDKTEITKDVTLGTDGLSGRASFSNSDNDGVDNVSFAFKEETKSALTLTLNTDPELTASDFKVIYGEDVINYMQFTYSGDQSVLENVSIKFSLPKTKSKDPNTIRLARLESGVWKYYVPTFEDKETYYQFTAVVPGFSYFAIVNYKEATINTTIDQNTNNNSSTNNTNNTNNNNNNVVDNSNTTDDNNKSTVVNNDVEDDDSDKVSVDKTASNTLYWIIGIVVILGVLVWLYIYIKNRPKKQNFSFNSNNVQQEVQKPSL